MTTGIQRTRETRKISPLALMKSDRRKAISDVHLSCDVQCQPKFTQERMENLAYSEVRSRSEVFVAI